MKPAAFTYHAPHSIEEAVGLLAELGEDAKAIAGGQSLVPMLALRLAAFEHLIDLRHLHTLRGITRRNGALRIGATTTQTTIQHSPQVADAAPLLARATPLIGHFQIRNRGTIGGSLAHADPAAEYPATALALDAELETTSPRGTRSIAADHFFTGLWSTALAEDELLTAITLPTRNNREGRSGFAIEEFARRAGDFAIAGAAIAVHLDTDDRITRCRIALFGLGPTAQRATTTEAALTGSAAADPDADTDADEIGHAAIAELDAVPADLHATADYRRQVGAVMVARAWQQAVQEASQEAAREARND